uniref:Uncharacterized protein n=1 Tax=Trichogramma kaykai TaxID=54128 RepID=A0ABD2VW99_9HYME
MTRANDAAAYSAALLYRLRPMIASYKNVGLANADPRASLTDADIYKSLPNIKSAAFARAWERTSYGRCYPRHIFASNSTLSRLKHCDSESSTIPHRSSSRPGCCSLLARCEMSTTRFIPRAHFSLRPPSRIARSIYIYTENNEIKIASRAKTNTRVCSVFGWTKNAACKRRNHYC